ncbi:hypothetical protein B296_00041848 [Ensete ventricosum]|uniref:Uncharacterized protein n=1 Tax=Ensete ventricosum TaxID=4639 RepID=A0A426ZC31_ENSVE|nr:hypothetical protein B296_00041848 [Ensete ventricosum]
MKMTIPSLVASYCLCPDQVGGLEEPLVLDLEENLCPSQVKATWARKAIICSEGSKLPSYGSRAGSRKLVGIGLSCISRINGDLPLELSLISSFDLMNSLWISLSLWLTWCSCSLIESIESKEMTFSLEGTCTMSREWLTGYVAEAFESSDVTSTPSGIAERGLYTYLAKGYRTLGLTSTVTSGVVALYGESISTEAWHEGMVHHDDIYGDDGSSAGALFGRFHLG